MVTIMMAVMAILVIAISVSIVIRVGSVLLGLLTRCHLYSLLYTVVDITNMTLSDLSGKEVDGEP